MEDVATVPCPFSTMDKLLVNLGLAVTLAVVFIGTPSLPGASASGMQCFVEGECLDSLMVDVVNTNNSRECLHHCQFLFPFALSVTRSGGIPGVRRRASA